MLLDGHINVLCELHDIRRVMTVGTDGSRLERREIRHPAMRVMSTRGYFMALHEIAGIVMEPVDDRLEHEAARWNWVIENCVTKPDTDVRQMICASLWRLLVRARMRDWPLPEEGSSYWELMEWWG
jgi:hypothetical protein